MPRRPPPDRLERIVDCASRIFIERGYKRAQMADVAEALGVAKGTLYLYVESKEALFDLVLRSADAERPLPSPALPVGTPREGATLRYVRERVAKNQILPTLAAALARTPAPANAATELEAIVRELYGVLAGNRMGIKLIDQSARDYPALAALWFEGARGGVLELFAGYLEDRIRRGLLRPVPEAWIAARLITETAVYWAVHRHWDAHPEPIDDTLAADTVVRFVVGALAEEPSVAKVREKTRRQTRAAAARKK